MSALLAMAQESGRDRSVNLELFGPTNMIGLSYDARIKPGSGWGYRTGLGYSYGFAGSFVGDSKSHAVTVPLEINYLVGKKKHHLELGVGTSLGVYHNDYQASWSEWIPNDPENSTWGVDGTWEEHSIHKKSTNFGYFIYGNLGYRYNAKRGFQFRCGLMPSFNFGDRHGVTHDPKLFPYLSVGYAF